MHLLAPRLDLRQSQSLVMTPQLRQAIKLLQSSNLDVFAFVEEELERNPLLELDEDGARADPPPALVPLPGDCHAAIASGTMPAEAEAPLDAGWRDLHDADGHAGGYDGAYSGRGGRTDFSDDSADGVEDTASSRRTLREHLGEQIRLGFADAGDRLIAAQLLALLDPAGRLAVEDAALASALGCETARVAAIRARMQRFDPTGLFCRDLRECLAVQLAERDRLDPAMQALLDNLDLLAKRDRAGLMRLCGVDAEDLADMAAEIRRLDPKPGASFDAAPAPALVPDVLMRRTPDGGGWHGTTW